MCVAMQFASYTSFFFFFLRNNFFSVLKSGHLLLHFFLKLYRTAPKKKKKSSWFVASGFTRDVFYCVLNLDEVTHDGTFQGLFNNTCELCIAFGASGSHSGAHACLHSPSELMLAAAPGMGGLGRCRWRRSDIPNR